MIESPPHAVPAHRPTGPLTAYGFQVTPIWNTRPEV